MFSVNARPRRSGARPACFTLVELLVVIGIIVALISIVLPLISTVRSRATLARLESERRRYTNSDPSATAPAAPHRARARLSQIDATISLTPRLSVGTVEAESIYEVAFAGTIEAAAPGDSERCAVELPLPPQIVSLSDVSVTVDGAATTDDLVQLADGKLVWSGALPQTPTKLGVNYAAVGRGIYCLEAPTGAGILDRFRMALAANGSDVRMLELSMQPTSVTRSNSATTYTWDYKRLMFGRPIALDVLGIAPIDRLGELRWLGPLSVMAFGAVVGFVGRTYPSRRFDRWMLLLLIGTFTAAYPLMYFAQEYLPLGYATASAGAVVLLIIAVRASSILGLRAGIVGVALPAAAIMALTLACAVRPQLQGILLTSLAVALFVMAMALGPKLQGLNEPVTVT